jgi:hypothetical protein
MLLALGRFQSPYRAESRFQLSALKCRSVDDLFVGRDKFGTRLVGSEGDKPWLHHHLLIKAISNASCISHRT